MISIREQGEFLKVGLNLCFASNHVAVHWVWFDFATHEGSHRGFTISRKGLRWRKARWNVIDEFMRLRGLEMVNAEVLQDLKATEKSVMRVNEPLAYIKP